MVNMHYEDEQEEDRGDMTKNRSDTENSGRKSIGRRRKGASFPAPVAKDELPAAYASLLSQVQERIRSERLRVVSAANEALVLLYWDIGQAILYRQDQEGWGAKVIDRLHTTCGRCSQTCGVSRRATSNTCALSPPSGLNAQLCNRLLHKFRGGRTSSSWTSSLTAKSVYGTPKGPGRRDGVEAYF